MFVMGRSEELKVVGRNCVGNEVFEWLGLDWEFLEFFEGKDIVICIGVYFGFSRERVCWKDIN